MKQLFSFSLLVVLSIISIEGYSQKRSMTVDDVASWRRIMSSDISDVSGALLVNTSQWRGSSTVYLFDKKGKRVFEADSATDGIFIPDSKEIFYVKGQEKIKRAVLYNPESKEVIDVDSLKSYKIGDNGLVVVYQLDSALCTINKKERKRLFSGAISYYLSQKGDWMVVRTKRGLFRINTGNGECDTICNESRIDKYIVDDESRVVSFIRDSSLWIWTGEDGARLAIPKGDKEVVNGEGRLIFSKGGERIFFETIRPKRRALLSEKDMPVVHIWNWRERDQFTAQVVERDERSKRGHLNAIDVNSFNRVIIEGDIYDRAIISKERGHNYALIISDYKYRRESMWTGRSVKDISVADLVLGRIYPVCDSLDADPKISTSGRYAYWYNNRDSSWYTFSFKTLELAKVTSPAVIKAADEMNDTPDLPSDYGFAGWTKDDQKMVVYDRYDIWLVDPRGVETPEKITLNGREREIVYRLVVSKDDDVIDLNSSVIYCTKDNDKSSYFAKLSDKKGRSPEIILGGDYKLGEPKLSKGKQFWLYTKERFDTYPDIWVADREFKNERKVTNFDTLRAPYIWGKAEMIEWISLDGKKLRGVVYKPENFDSLKRYPMIVNFYETNSSTFHSFRTPEPHRSTVDYHLYNSNGYIIFNPDIVYNEGYPGESAYNCIMPGISYLISKGYVDEKRIGAQGHSWGGYQVAYLATRTSLFAAIESGAPVVNMFSAYGGIRWGTGLNRSFQYEHQQSRIGKTPWESPLRYMENSPLFYMDKVTTPILIMHNDKDGHVPWYQGIEFFVALKRLQKPVWLLNYTGEIHWPLIMKNKIDFQKRMLGFFNHYLKGEKMPKWMEEPILLQDLEIDTNY